MRQLDKAVQARTESCEPLAEGSAVSQPVLQCTQGSLRSLREVAFCTFNV